VSPASSSLRQGLPLILLAPLLAFPGHAAELPGTQTLIPIGTTKPNIPDEACQQRLSGWVDLDFAVLPDGRVADVRVSASQPRGVFDAAAVASVSEWTYASQPAPAKVHQRLVMSYADCRREQLRGSAPATPQAGGPPSVDCAAIATQARQLGDPIAAAESGRAVLADETAQAFSAPDARCAAAGRKFPSAIRLVAHREYQGFSLVSLLKASLDSAVWVRSNQIKDTTPVPAESAAAPAVPGVPATPLTPAVPPTPTVPAAEASSQLRRAIAIADAFLPSLAVKGDYKLVAAQNGVSGNEYKGPAFWRLTYQSCGARSASVEPICKGGEAYIGVDLGSGKASFLGAGE
jgi:TonB family protein